MFLHSQAKTLTTAHKGLYRAINDFMRGYLSYSVFYIFLDVHKKAESFFWESIKVCAVLAVSCSLTWLS